MITNNKIMRSLNEVAIIASEEPSDIESRGTLDVYDKDGMLPIFVSPMTCIVNDSNMEKFRENGFIPILPRLRKDSKGKNVSLDDRVVYGLMFNSWIAVSKSEMKELISGNQDCNSLKVLIDVAQGGMKCLYDLVREAKAKYPGMTVMIGNIAHPNMYMECLLAGVDYVRVSVGCGSVCSTGMVTGVHMSMVELLEGIADIKNRVSSYASQPISIQNTFSSDYTWGKYTSSDLLNAAKHKTYVIADGGLDTIDKQIKCLSLGADYVMLGHKFAECEEACGFRDAWKKLHYYGMASEQGQIDMLGEVQKESEGIDTWVPMTTTLEKYKKEFKSALRSSMSYTGTHNLEEFRTKVEHRLMSEAEYNEYYKK